LSIYDPNFVTFIREAISNGDFDQSTNQILSKAQTICHHALQKHGVHHLLLHASYPVTVCRSPDDEIVSFRNVPEDFFRKPNGVLRKHIVFMQQQGYLQRCIDDLCLDGMKEYRGGRQYQPKLLYQYKDFDSRSNDFRY
jgi:hypothetical protein